MEIIEKTKDYTLIKLMDKNDYISGDNYSLGCLNKCNYISIIFLHPIHQIITLACYSVELGQIDFIIEKPTLDLLKKLYEYNNKETTPKTLNLYDPTYIGTLHCRSIIKKYILSTNPDGSHKAKNWMMAMVLGG